LNLRRIQHKKTDNKEKRKGALWFHAAHFTAGGLAFSYIKPSALPVDGSVLLKKNLSNVTSFNSGVLENEFYLASINVVLKFWLLKK